MVHGRSTVADPHRRADVMAERDLPDFHRELATFRFRPVSGHGAWPGRSGIVPTRPTRIA